MGQFALGVGIETDDRRVAVDPESKFVRRQGPLQHRDLDPGRVPARRLRPSADQDVVAMYGGEASEGRQRKFEEPDMGTDTGC